MSARRIDVLEHDEVLIPLCPKCMDDMGVFCDGCGNDYIGCDCVDESSAWFCMKCEHDFDLDIRTGYSSDYDQYNDDIVVDAVPGEQDFFQDKDGRWYWDDGTEAKCYCYNPKVLTCVSCGVSRQSATAHWNPWVEFDSKEPVKTSTTYTTPSGTKVTTYGTYPGIGTAGHYSGYSDDFWGKCNHLMKEILLKETTIYGSSLNDSRSHTHPDFGLYADWSWQPWWRQEHIDWRDYGMPTDYEVAYDQIVDAFDKAKAGKKVEVGCIGGHGRTGTILACMAVLDGFTSKDAITHIEKSYCTSIIETMDQEWYVEWFEAKFKGLPEPAKRVYVPSSTSTTCFATDHHTMLKAGLTACKRENCSTWPLDVDRYLMGWDTKEAISERYKPKHLEPVKPESATPKTIKEIAKELKDQLALPLPALPAAKPEQPANRKFIIGQVKDGFVMTAKGWEPLYNEDGSVVVTHPKKKNSRKRRKGKR